MAHESAGQTLPPRRTRMKKVALPPNPGNDPMVVMRNSNGAANEVNRTERPAFVGWNKELWMQK
jgi:hypothetical protein